MNSLSQAKTLGGVGSILAVCAVVPSVGWLLGLVGFVLVLVAIKYISDFLKDPSIFNNMIISVVTGIAGLIVGGIFIFASVFRFVGIRWQEVGPGPEAIPSDVFRLLLAILVGLVIVWVCFIISAIFRRRSYNEMSAKLGVGLFGTAALIYLIGAALTVVLIGFILIIVAEIIDIVAFFSIPELPPPPKQT